MHTTKRVMYFLDKNTLAILVDNDHEAYKLWNEDDSMAKCYVLAFLGNGIHKHHELLNSTKEIIAKLKKMFG